MFFNPDFTLTNSRLGVRQFDPKFFRRLHLRLEVALATLKPLLHRLHHFLFCSSLLRSAVSLVFQPMDFSIKFDLFFLEIGGGLRPFGELLLQTLTKPLGRVTLTAQPVLGRYMVDDARLQMTNALHLRPLACAIGEPFQSGDGLGGLCFHQAVFRRIAGFVTVR